MAEIAFRKVREPHGWLSNTSPPSYWKAGFPAALQPPPRPNRLRTTLRFEMRQALQREKSGG